MELNSRHSRRMPSIEAIGQTQYHISVTVDGLTWLTAPRYLATPPDGPCVKTLSIWTRPVMVDHGSATGHYRADNPASHP